MAVELKEQVEITTPATGKKLVLRGYITGRIKQELEAIFLNESEVKSIDGSTESNVKGSVMVKATNRALELIVLSVDGSAEDVLNKVLDLPEQDYDFVVAEVNKIQRPLATTS